MPPSSFSTAASVEVCRWVVPWCVAVSSGSFTVRSGELCWMVLDRRLRVRLTVPVL